MTLAKQHNAQREGTPQEGKRSCTRDPAESKARTVIVIQNDKGLHTRPATELVRCTSRYKSNVQLTYSGITVNGKSLLGILMLAAGKGSKIEVIAQGEDAQDVVTAISQLVSCRFHIQY